MEGDEDVPDAKGWDFHFAPLWVAPADADAPWRVGGSSDLGMANGLRLHWHVSSLAGGAVPHAPHRHRDEELIVPLETQLGIIRERDTLDVRPRGVAMHPSECLHTLRAVGTRASYAVLRWQGPEIGEPAIGDQSLVSNAETVEREAVSPGWHRTALIDRPTQFLPRLRVHLSEMSAGSGYGFHSDGHDLAIVLLEGTVVSMTRRVSAPAVLLHRAGTLHDIRCEGPGDARWIAVEFHRAA